MQRPFRLGVLTALWRRPHVSEPVLAHYAAMRIEGVALVRLAVTSPEDPEPCPHVHGWHLASAPNSPLSEKWNVGMRALGNMMIAGDRLHAVMVVGSDDLVSAEHVAAAVQAVSSGAELVRAEGVVFYDLATGRASEGRMRRMGAGRVLSGPLLHRLGWRPWPPGLDRALDGGMDRHVHALDKAAGRPHRETVLRSAPPIVDVKSAVNLWSYETMAGHTRRDLAPAETRALFRTHYPEALPLLDMATKPKTSKTAPKADAPKGDAPKAPKLSVPVDKAPKKRAGGTFNAAKAAEAEATEKAAQDADEAKAGTVRLRALKNVPAELAGTDRRVYRGREWDAPASRVRSLTSQGLAEEVK